MPPLFRYLVVIVVIAVLLWLLLPKPAFVIEIREGEIKVKKGKVPAGFVEDLEKITLSERLPDSKIRGVTRHGAVSLKFSRRVPQQHHQRLRNIWSFHA